MGNTTITVLMLTLLMGVLIFLATGRAFKIWRRLRGPRVVTCPETGRPAAVTVDAVHAATSVVADSAPEVRLADCSRWPGRYPCGEDCLTQIETAADGCEVRSIVRTWYAGKACAYCGKAIEDAALVNHHAALMSPNGTTVEWTDVLPEQLPQLFTTHKPVCWDCHMAETFRRVHPELVVDRPVERRA